MDDFVFTRQFLNELSEFQKSTSEDDLKSLEKTLATIVRDPYLRGRVPSFYDPSLPSYLYRAGNVLIHFRVNQRRSIEFINLFWSRV